LNDAVTRIHEDTRLGMMYTCALICILLYNPRLYGIYSYNNDTFIEKYPFEMVSYNNISFKRYKIAPNSSILQQYVDDSSYEFTGLNSSDYKPSFIHIPKTGGTSIEVTFLSMNIGVGQYAFSSGFINNKDLRKTAAHINDRRKYSINDTFHDKCSRFHTPPSNFIHKSFTVIRDPFDRLVSEWCHHMLLYNKVGRYSGYTIFLVNHLIISQEILSICMKGV